MGVHLSRLMTYDPATGAFLRLGWITRGDNFGSFDTPEEAHQRYVEAKRRHHEFRQALGLLQRHLAHDRRAWRHGLPQAPDSRRPCGIEALPRRT
jgi:hypothetical protein